MIDEQWHFFETAYDDWFAEVYDDWYRELWDETTGPVATLIQVLGSLKGLAGRTPSTLRILDCACGTGNIYIPLRLGGYDVRAADASRRMLDRAIVNCGEKHALTDNLVKTPVQWTNKNAYEQLFGAQSFDVLILFSNSFCHLPSHLIPEALQNFRALLRPGGYLIIDTKRYRRSGTIKETPLHKELRHVDGRWITRVDREDPNRVVNGNIVDFHTWLQYDIDPIFRICRALVIVTMAEQNGRRRTTLWPYYPLPAKALTDRMKHVGFETAILKAREHKLLRDYSYDVVIGRKRDHI
jgi:SAM-dependent methyltransferase